MEAQNRPIDLEWRKPTAMKYKHLACIVPALLSALIVLVLAPSTLADAKNQTASAAPAAHSSYRFAVTQFGVADSVSCPGWYSGWQDNLNSAVCDMLTTEMVKDGWSMVEREKLKDITNEQDLGASGRTDQSTSPQIGKLLGADYLIVGTITEWGMKNQNIGGGGNVFGNIFGNHGYGDSAQYHSAEAVVKIDYRVVNTKTGVIEPGSAGTATGENKTQGISLTSSWWNSINLSEDDWTQTQIGKATRQAVQQIAQQLGGWNPTDGGASHDRTPVTASVVAVISPDEFVIDHGQDEDVRVGDTFDVFSLTPIKNSSGKVVYESQTKVGSATVADVQSAGARLDFSNRIPGTARLKEGDQVKFPSVAGGG